MGRKTATDTRLDKLQRMATHGGTPNEREIARNKLNTLPAVHSEESGDIWIPMGNLIRVRNGNRAFMRGPALKHFLGHLKDGQVFNNRTIPMNEEFGPGDFYTVLSWLLKHGLCAKNGSKYAIHSKHAVVQCFNKQVDAMKL